MMKLVLNDCFKHVLGGVLGAFLVCGAPCGAMDVPLQDKTELEKAVSLSVSPVETPDKIDLEEKVVTSSAPAVETSDKQTIEEDGPYHREPRYFVTPAKPIDDMDSDKTWLEEEAFNKRLKEQDFSHIMNDLYLLVARADTKDEVEDWIGRGALLGHVSMLYMDMRRFVYMPDDTMETMQREEFFKEMCIALLRTAQDVACCEFILGQTTARDAYAVLQKKFYVYFLSTHEARRWPDCTTVFAQVHNWFKQSERIKSLPSPAWCCSFGWVPYRPKTVAFATPDECLLKMSETFEYRSSIDLMRARVYAKAKSVLYGVHNWDAFFQLPVDAFFPETISDVDCND